MLRRNRRLGLRRENGIQTLFVERERLYGEKHLVRKELARVRLLRWMFCSEYRKSKVWPKYQAQSDADENR